MVTLTLAPCGPLLSISLERTWQKGMERRWKASDVALGIESLLILSLTCCVGPGDPAVVGEQLQEGDNLLECLSLTPSLSFPFPSPSSSLCLSSLSLSLFSFWMSLPFCLALFVPTEATG